MMHGLDVADFGARLYNPTLPQWDRPDDHASSYSQYSPYIYCASNPVNAIDEEGKLVIFINGMHFGSGGKPEYWEGMDDKIMNIIGDNKALYLDGSSGGILNTAQHLTQLTVSRNLNPFDRYHLGYIQGAQNAFKIFAKLTGNETIKFISHSMGAAYTKGFIKGLYDIALQTGKNMDGLIEYEIDLAPFQPGLQHPHPKVPTYVIQHRFDNIAGTGEMPDVKKQWVSRDKFIHHFLGICSGMTHITKTLYGANEHGIKSFRSDLEIIKEIHKKAKEKHKQ